MLETAFKTDHCHTERPVRSAVGFRILVNQHPSRFQTYLFALESCLLTKQLKNGQPSCADNSRNALSTRKKMCTPNFSTVQISSIDSAVETLENNAQP